MYLSKNLTYPQIYAVPEDGAVIPVNMLNKVVFPAPLCPKMAVISPGNIFKLMPFTAYTGSFPTDLKVFFKSWITIASEFLKESGMTSMSGPTKLLS